jgi:hypothetical protein
VVSIDDHDPSALLYDEEPGVSGVSDGNGALKTRDNGLEYDVRLRGGERDREDDEKGSQPDHGNSRLQGWGTQAVGSLPEDGGQEQLGHADSTTRDLDPPLHFFSAEALWKVEPSSSDIRFIRCSSRFPSACSRWQ